jgi:hypothetical protein
LGFATRLPHCRIKLGKKNVGRRARYTQRSNLICTLSCRYATKINSSCGPHPTIASIVGLPALTPTTATAKENGTRTGTHPSSCRTAVLQLLHTCPGSARTSSVSTRTHSPISRSSLEVVATTVEGPGRLHRVLVPPPRPPATSLRATATATDMDTVCPPSHDSLFLPPPNHRGIIRIFVLYVSITDRTIDDNKLQHRRRQQSARRSTRYNHSNRPCRRGNPHLPTRGVNARTNGTTLLHGVAWPRTVRESSSGGARRRD